MFDFGLLTFFTIAASSAFGMVGFIGNTITIDKIMVPKHLESKGLSDAVVTRLLTDEIRELNVVAGSELASVKLDSTLSKSVSALESYFQVEQLTTGVLDLFGLVPFYVSGEVTGEPYDITMTLRIFYSEEDRLSDVVRSSGTVENFHEVVLEAALGVAEHVNPYVVALYWRRIEAAERNYTFPRTRKVIDRYLEDRPVEQHFLAYGLLGRMAMVQAERQAGLTPEQQQAGYAEAQRYFEAALLQQPDFLFATLNLGLVHAATGNYDRAEATFAEAVEIDPNHLGTRTSWAEMLEKQGRIREAAFQRVAAVEIDRNDPVLRQELAETYLNLGMADDARTQIDQAIALDPTHARKYQDQFHLREVALEKPAGAPAFRRNEPAFAMGSSAD